jgi:hypothetical protein
MTTEHLPKRVAIPKEKKAATLASKRRRRIRDHALQSVEHPDALLANIGAEAANLMSLGQLFHEAIQTNLANSNQSLEDLEKVGPALEQYLKLTRQWERLEQFGQRVATDSKNRESLKVA